jgi:putative transposase
VLDGCLQVHQEVERAAPDALSSEHGEEVFDQDHVATAAALDAFEHGPWGQKYPAIAQSWRRAWSEAIPFYAFPGEVRRILYTTNAIEALNAKLRRAVQARSHFSTDDPAMKMLFLVLHRAEKAWIMPPREWTMAKAQFAILFGECFSKAQA